MFAWAFPTRYESEQALTAQRRQAGLETVPGITCTFGFNFVFDRAYRMRKSFGFSTDEIGLIFSCLRAAMIDINTDNRAREE
jgi:hypothetical protein